MRSRSSSSVGAVYLDRDARIAELRASAIRAAGRIPGLQRVILFGSLAKGIPTPRSDADLLVIVAESEHREPRDRVPEVIRALAPLPCPIDLFVLTASELERHTAGGDALVREALAHGRDLLGPANSGRSGS